MRELTVVGKQVAVIGGGRSGVAAAELLKDRGARVTLTDLKPRLADEERLRAAGVALELGGHCTETLLGADLVVVSPGVSWIEPTVAAARRAGVPVIGEVELASRWIRGRMIAVTGTKGKSTTTALIGRVLEASGNRAVVGGNIGTALCAQVAASTPDTLHVVEVSSFQLEATETFHPWIAVILNFSPDHLDRHADEEEYARAKRRIWANQDSEDWVVVNADDRGALMLAEAAPSQRRLFAVDRFIPEGVVVSGDQIAERTFSGDLPLVPVASVRLTGRHLLADVVAAVAAARLAGVRDEAIRRAVESFRGLEHAMESVAEIQGVRFINDSKATNVESARRAIESVGGNLVLILGGRFKGGNLRDLREPLAERARTAIAIGEASPRVQDAIGDVVSVRVAESMGAAVRLAFASAPPGGTVLLAPACASFDMFSDYAERGRVFKQEVARLAEEVDSRGEQ